MTERTISEKKIQKGLEILFDKEWREVPPEGMIASEHTFSQEFLDSMRELTESEGPAPKKVRRIPWKRYVTRVAAAAAAVVIVALGARAMLPGKGKMAGGAPANDAAVAAGTEQREAEAPQTCGYAVPELTKSHDVAEFSTQRAAAPNAAEVGGAQTEAEDDWQAVSFEVTAAAGIPSPDRRFTGEIAADGVTVTVERRAGSVQVSIRNGSEAAVTVALMSLAPSGEDVKTAGTALAEIEVEAGRDGAFLMRGEDTEEAETYEAIVRIGTEEYRVRLLPEE